MDKDQSGGRFEESRGKAREVAGKIRGDDGQELMGKGPNKDGKVRAAYGDPKANMRKVELPK